MLIWRELPLNRSINTGFVQKEYCFNLGCHEVKELRYPGRVTTRSTHRKKEKESIS